MSGYAEVVVPLPVWGRFHYAVPDALDGALQIGHRVLVPFGRRRVTGFVVALVPTVEESIVSKVRPIEARLDLEPLVPADILDLTTFAADYYLAPRGEVLKAALPPGLTAASVQKWVATAAGREAHTKQARADGAPLSDAEKELLKGAVRAAGVRASKSAVRVAEALETEGLIAKKEQLDARESDEVEVLERLLDSKAAWESLRGARTRLRLFELLEGGPRTLSSLRDELGAASLRRALTRLEADGVVARKKVPRAAVEAPITAPTDAAWELTAEQAEAFARISVAIDAGLAQPFLLYGVTGSGKTEIYMRSIARALDLGKNAIVLVPEIALTPQLENRFRARFGDRVEVLHSGIPDAERRRRWHRLKSGEARIALGARSALWAPVPHVGVIVVDEEHDPSFKQSSDVRYNGRDLALTRARRAGAVAILGSATPSLETMNLARTGRMEELRLSARVGDRPMPVIQVVDLVEERSALKGEVHLISRALGDRLREVIAKKQQAIIFLNRRGFNTIVYCAGCGDARKCGHCDVSLTHHRAERALVCHYCGHSEPFASPCPKCASRDMQAFGAGTQRVVEAVLEEVPDARVLRLDRDVTSKVGALDRTLATFRAGEADVLVGTQMVAKGHDFPKVTLVGILLADSSLAFPDFRAAERTFQILTQVAGRAGRAGDPGHVVIQTFQPRHYALLAALDHDADRFFDIEANSRERSGYPPFTRIGLVRIEHRDSAEARRTAERVGESARHHAESRGARVLGPAPAPIEKIRDRYRQQVMVFAPSPAKLVDLMTRVKADLETQNPRADLTFDVDPVDLL